MVTTILHSNRIIQTTLGLRGRRDRMPFHVGDVLMYFRPFSTKYIVRLRGRVLVRGVSTAFRL